MTDKNPITEDVRKDIYQSYDDDERTVLYRINETITEESFKDHGTWYCLNESVVAENVHRALRKYAKQNVDYFIHGEDFTEYSDVVVFIDVQWFESLDTQKLDNFINLVLQKAVSDSDVRDFVMDVIERKFNYKTTDVPSEGTVSLIEYVKWLKTSEHVLDKTSGMIMLINDRSIGFERTESGGAFIEIRGNAYHVDKFSKLKLSCYATVPLTRSYDVNGVEYVPASEEDISGRIKAVSERLEKNSIYYSFDGIGHVPTFFGSKQLYVNSRVILDQHGLHLTDTSTLHGLWGIHGIDSMGSPTFADEPVTDEQKAIVCPLVPLYDLNKKRWFIANEIDLSDIQFAKDAFEKLKLDPTKKKMIRRLCESNGKNTRAADIIGGKGGGHIFLLHGAAGTGKTLTAESVSELLEKPLYKISLSEYSDLSRLESSLEIALTLAERWDAVMLIDEADVALEQRSSNDLERNAIVAVFLRLLEYYEGVMFLTSNRAKQFDAAFKSRITFALQYHKPSLKDREYIWEMLMRNSGLNPENYEVGLYASSLFDGRQIKNIINTACSLAGDAEVTHEDITTIIAQTREFSSFMGN